MSNEEAILVYGLGDPTIFNRILHNFQFLIRKVSGEVYHRSHYRDILDFEDLIHAGHAGLKQAIETYRFGEVPFAAYAKTVIERAVNAVSRALDAPTMRMMNNAQSLDDYVCDEKEGLRLCDVVGVHDVFTTQEFSSEMIYDISDFIHFDVDEIEQKVIIAKILGYTNHEILEHYQMSRRQLQSVLTRLRKKHCA